MEYSINNAKSFPVIDPDLFADQVPSCDTLLVELDIGRSVYHFLQYIYIYIHSNEIHNVAALIVY